jgi:hypothetical protein
MIPPIYLPPHLTFTEVMGLDPFPPDVMPIFQDSLSRYRMCFTSTQDGEMDYVAVATAGALEEPLLTEEKQSGKCLQIDGLTD